MKFKKNIPRIACASVNNNVYLHKHFRQYSWGARKCWL